MFAARDLVPLDGGEIGAREPRHATDMQPSLADMLSAHPVMPGRKQQT